MNLDSTSNEHATRPSLLVRLHDASDELAWSEFSIVYEPVIYQMVKRRGLQDADAREIVQEVLMSVAAAIDRFDVNGSGSFRGWLSRITRNATIDRLRTLRSRRETVGGSKVARAIDAVPFWDQEESNEALLQEFDHDHRQHLFRWAAGKVRARTGETNWIAFWRTAVESHPVADVGRVDGCASESTDGARSFAANRDG